MLFKDIWAGFAGGREPLPHRAAKSEVDANDVECSGAQEVPPAATATRASGAAASLAAELMVAVKGALISLHGLRNAKPLAKSLWMMSKPKDN